MITEPTPWALRQRRLENLAAFSARVLPSPAENPRRRIKRQAMREGGITGKQFRRLVRETRRVERERLRESQCPGRGQSSAMGSRKDGPADAQPVAPRRRIPAAATHKEE